MQEGRNMKKLIPAAFILAAFLTAPAGAQGWQELVTGDFTLRWATMPGDSLAVELSAPTTGWVAVGFDPDSIMLGANIIIGYVVSGTPTLRDDYGWQVTGHRDDLLLGGTRDLTVDGATEAGGTTEIRFTIPLDSGDPYDKPLVPGSTYPIILAMGPNGADDFSTQHQAVAVAQISLWGLSLSQETWGGIKSSID
jgi:hypothetical protein